MASEEDKKLISNLEKVSASLAGAAKKLDQASEELSNKGVDKLTNSIKDFLKVNGQLTAAQFDMIKDMRALSAHLEDVEDDFIKLSKADAKLVSEMDALRKANIAGVDQIETQQRRELGLSKDYINQKRQELETTKNFIEAQTRNAKATDGISKAVEKHTETIKAQVAKWTSIGTGLTMIADAAKQAYNDMNTYSQKGLLGAFSTMSLVSKKLLMTGMEFSEIINKNRDLVNQMGGGAKGIEALADTISQARQGLEYMGKEGTKAAARFVEMNKNLGLTSKDGEAYQKALRQTKDQFKKFSGLFGDSYEEFAQLIETQEQEENTRRRLNNMSKDQLALARQDLLVRTENMKMMGLSNQQIMEFNKRTEDMNNPRKSGQIGTRMKEGQMAKNLVSMLQNSGTQEGADLVKHSDTLNDYFTKRQNGDAKGMKDVENSKDGMEALKALSKARTSIDRLDPNSREGINRVDEMAGVTTQNAFAHGDAGNTAELKGANILGMQKDKQAEIIANTKKMQEGLDDKLGDLGTKMANLSVVVETVKNILNDPFTKALLGGIVMLAGLALAARQASAALSAMKGLAGGKGSPDVPDVPDKNGKSGKGDGKGGSTGKMATAGKLIKGAGMAGVVLDAGLGINDLINGKSQTDMSGTDYISPMRYGMYAGEKINQGVEAINGKSIGNSIYDWFNKDPFANDPTMSVSGNLPQLDNLGRVSSGARSSTPIGPGATQSPSTAKPASGKNGDPSSRRSALEAQMDSAGIKDPKERAAFLAQMDHESGGFKFMTEIGKNAGVQYEGRKDLGNTQTGDGQKFKGRGFIQLTGRANYDKYGKMVGQDLINNPELAADPMIAAQIATAYWKDKKLSQKLTNNGFDAVTKSINGGFNGKADRDQKFAMYQGQQSTQVASAATFFSEDSANNLMNPNMGGKVTPINPPTSAMAVSGVQAAANTVTVNDPNSKTVVAVLERIEQNTRFTATRKANAYQQSPGVVAQNVG